MFWVTISINQSLGTYKCIINSTYASDTQIITYSVSTALNLNVLCIRTRHLNSMYDSYNKEYLYAVLELEKK